MSTLMQRIMAARLGKPVTAPASIPTPAQPLEPGRVEYVPMAERRARIAEGHARRNAPSNAAFEAKREQWRAEALRKAREPAPPPAPVTSSAPKRVEPVCEHRYLTVYPIADRVESRCSSCGALLGSSPRTAPVTPVSVQRGAPRGSCKAINAETGRQCALLAGHTKPHRHGSTDFVRVATPGQSSFARRDALDALAAASNPTTPGEAQ